MDGMQKLLYPASCFGAISSNDVLFTNFFNLRFRFICHMEAPAGGLFREETKNSFGRLRKNDSSDRSSTRCYIQ